MSTILNRFHFSNHGGGYADDWFSNRSFNQTNLVGENPWFWNRNQTDLDHGNTTSGVFPDLEGVSPNLVNMQ